MLTRVHPITRISLLHLRASSLANFIYFVLVKWYIVDLDRLGVSIGSSGAIELFIGDKMYRTDGLSRLDNYHYESTYYNTILRFVPEIVVLSELFLRWSMDSYVTFFISLHFVTFTKKRETILRYIQHIN